MKIQQVLFRWTDFQLHDRSNNYMSRGKYVTVSTNNDICCESLDERSSRSRWMGWPTPAASQPHLTFLPHFPVRADKETDPASDETPANVAGGSQIPPMTQLYLRAWGILAEDRKPRHSATSDWLRKQKQNDSRLRLQRQKHVRLTASYSQLWLQT